MVDGHLRIFKVLLPASVDDPFVVVIIIVFVVVVDDDEKASNQHLRDSALGHVDAAGDHATDRHATRRRIDVDVNVGDVRLVACGAALAQG